MGIIKRGILGGFSNKVANVVGSSWKGIAVIKALPLSVANPNTAAQQGQRGKFGQCVDFASSILTTIVKPLWDRAAQQMSGFNAFIQANIDFFDSTGLATPASLLISRGPLLNTVFVSIGGDQSDQDCDVAWTNNAGTGNALGTDVSYFLVFNETTGEIAGVKSGVARSIGSDSVPCSGLTAGDTIRVYMAFKSADGFIVSNTVTSTAVVAP